jgi:hypothetical protein
MSAKEHCLSSVIGKTVVSQAGNVPTLRVVRFDASLKILVLREGGGQTFLKNVSFFYPTKNQGVSQYHILCLADEFRKIAISFLLKYFFSKVCDENFFNIIIIRVFKFLHWNSFYLPIFQKENKTMLQLQQRYSRKCLS